MDETFVVIAEDGFGSANGDAVTVVGSLEEAKAFVADPPQCWRGHVQWWPFGLAVYRAHRIDEEELR